MKMTKRIIVSFFVLLVCIQSNAQQDPLYAQYLNNPMVINPAYAGLNNNFNASVSYRSQWGGFDGKPVTMNVNSHIALVDNKVGAGFLLVSDQLGSVKNTEFQAAFSYKLELNNNVLSFGMQTGFINFRNNFGELNLADPNDPAFGQNENVTKPNLGFGLVLKSERYFLGVSIPRMLSSTVNTGGQEFDIYDQHFYLLGAYLINLNENIRIKPSVLLKGVAGAPMSVDVNFNVNIDARYTAGVFTRNFNTYGVILQMLLSDKYLIAYNFELPTNNSVGSQFTTNEIMLGIKVPLLMAHDRSITNF